MDVTEDQVTGKLNNLRLTASNEQNDPIYKMNPLKKGLAVIFHHEEIYARNLRKRNRTEADYSNLCNMLKRHNFAVFVHNDLRYKKLMSVIDKVSKYDFREFSCLLIVILSRDQDNNTIYAKDKAYSISNLFDQFTPDRCPTLAGKPKFYLFQAYQDESNCHINDETDGDAQTKENNGVQTYRLPSHADFLIVYSRVPGYYSCRNGERGSLFIQTFCEIARNWQDIDLLTMLTIVNNSIAVRFKTNCHLTPSMRIPCMTSMLTRSVRFTGIGNEERLTVTSNYDGLFYKMNHLKRGLAIIFNHENFDNPNLKPRRATKDDCLRIENMLDQLQFTVVVKTDFTFKQLDDYIEDVANNYNFSDCDCLFVAVLSHGEPNTIHAKDESYSMNKLFNRFTSDRCSTLDGKPRIFLIQACRGGNLDRGVDFVMQDRPVNKTGDRTNVADKRRSNVYPNSKSFEWSTNFHLQLPEDFIIAYSTVPEYSSMRNTIAGSFFIKMFCEEMSKHWLDKDLCSILTIVNRRVAFEFESNAPSNPSVHKKKQMPCFVSKLTRLVKFEIGNKNDSEMN